MIIILKFGITHSLKVVQTLLKLMRFKVILDMSKLSLDKSKHDVKRHHDGLRRPKKYRKVQGKKIFILDKKLC